MVAQRVLTSKILQLIPTNAGERSYASPPVALQQGIIPSELFYVRNHWREVPRIDINSYRLVVDGEVERPLNFSFEELKQMPRKEFRVTFECCGNSPSPVYWARAARANSVMEQIKGHGIMGNARWTGVPLAYLLNLAGLKRSAVDVMFEGAHHGPDEIVGDPLDVTY